MNIWICICEQTNRRLAPVAAALSRTGITFHLAQVRYYTTRFNRSLVNIGMYRPRLLRAWFDGGVVFGCVAMAMSMLLLMVTVVNMLSRQPTEQQILVPVVSFTFIAAWEVGKNCHKNNCQLYVYQNNSGWYAAPPPSEICSQPDPLPVRNTKKIIPTFNVP